ncbi:hypothetical protein SB768_32230, partial [Burkholderia sp. SIMBA_043]
DKTGKLLFFDKAKTSAINITQTESTATRMKNMAANNRNASNMAALAQNTINSKLENGKSYTLYKLTDSSWEKQETKPVANNTLSFSSKYQ